MVLHAPVPRRSLTAPRSAFSSDFQVDSASAPVGTGRAGALESGPPLKVTPIGTFTRQGKGSPPTPEDELMNLVSLRIITADIKRLVPYYEQITGGAVNLCTADFCRAEDALRHAGNR